MAPRWVGYTEEAEGACCHPALALDTQVALTLLPDRIAAVLTVVYLIFNECRGRARHRARLQLDGYRYWHSTRAELPRDDKERRLLDRRLVELEDGDG